MEAKVSVLVSLAKVLNINNIKWGVGASMLMYLKGINTAVNDIDIIIDINDLSKFLDIIEYAQNKNEEESPKYPTEHFYELTIKNVDLDIMFNYKVNTDDGIYDYPFDKDELEIVHMKNTKVYLLSIEEWLKAYKAMGRTDKVLVLEKYLKIG